MGWEIDKNRAICPQICEQIASQISKGELAPGERLYSVRQLAAMAGVNPNTVQKAFSELERQGLIYSVRGSGFIIAEQTGKAEDVVETLKHEKTEAYIKEMENIGVSLDEIKNYIKEWKR